MLLRCKTGVAKNFMTPLNTRRDPKNWSDDPAHWVFYFECAGSKFTGSWSVRPMFMSEEEGNRNQQKISTHVSSLVKCRCSVCLSGAPEQTLHKAQRGRAQCTERPPSAKSLSPEVPRMVRSVAEKSANQPSFCKELPFAKGRTSPRAKLRVL